MKFFFLNIISILFFIGCEQQSKINEWPVRLDGEFLSSCIRTSNQNIKYCNCILDKLKSDDNFNLNIKNLDNLLNNNMILENVFNECVE